MTSNVPFEEANRAASGRRRGSGLFWILLLVILGFLGYYFLSARNGAPSARVGGETAASTFGGAVGDSEATAAVDNIQPSSPGLLASFTSMIEGIFGGGGSDVTASGPSAADSGAMQAQMQIDGYVGQGGGQQAAQAGSTVTAEDVVLARADQRTLAKPKDYPYGFKDIVNRPVADPTGKSVGAVHDILVDRETGKSLAIVVNGDSDYRGVDLSAVKFDKVEGQDAKGEIKISTDASTVGSSPAFTYDDAARTRYVSLRSLEGGTVVDNEGNVAGKVDTVIYRNQTAQNILFTVLPSAARQLNTETFAIPYQDIKIETAANGATIIQLTEAQTAAMAKSLFDEPPVKPATAQAPAAATPATPVPTAQ